MIQDPNEEKRFTDEQTDKRVHELLLNEKDEVTEEDINNIRTDIIPAETPVMNEKKVPVEEPLENEKIEDDTDPEVDNSSWNVLEGDN